MIDLVPAVVRGEQVEQVQAHVLGGRPQAVSTRAQSFRMARTLAMVRNSSASADIRK